jgi:hypothetical protein
MNKAEFIRTLTDVHDRWEKRLMQFPQDVELSPGMWLKDLITHITWYEREMVGMLRERALVGSPLWDLPTTDERNAAILRESLSRPWSEVLAEARQVYQQFLEGVQSLTEDELVDPHLFANMPDDWVPWKVMAGNSYEHYLQHLPDLQGLGQE